MTRTMRSTTISNVAHLFVACLALVCQALAAEQTVTINHLTGLSTPSGVIKLKRDELLTVQIVATKIACFQFNEKTVEPPPPTGARTPSAGAPPPEVVTMSIIHDGLPHNYIIEASFRPGVTSCDLLAPKSWTITAQTDNWTLAFAGGFTGDRLTDPVFSLDPGKDPADSSKSGFFIRRFRTQQSFMTLGAAAMVHLYHSDPNALTVRHLRKINWVPISFGLGVNNQSDTRYFLGTGIRFDTKLFLVGGVVVGSVARLPNGLSEDGFTTNANALSTLGKQTTAQFFLALSYAFIETGSAPFQAPFKDAKPAVQNPQTKFTAKITVKIEKLDGDYKVTAANEGGPDPVKGAKVSASITGATASVTWKCKVISGGAVCTNENGKNDIVKEPVDLPKDASAIYTITAAGDNVKITASVELPDSVSPATGSKLSDKFPSS